MKTFFSTLALAAAVNAVKLSDVTGLETVTPPTDDTTLPPPPSPDTQPTGPGPVHPLFTLVDWPKYIYSLEIYQAKESGSTDTVEKSFDLILNSLFEGDKWGDANGKLNIEEITNVLEWEHLPFRRDVLRGAAQWLGQACSPFIQGQGEASKDELKACLNNFYQENPTGIEHMFFKNRDFSRSSAPATGGDIDYSLGDPSVPTTGGDIDYTATDPLAFTTGGDIVYPATDPSAPTTGGDIDYPATGPSVPTTGSYIDYTVTDPLPPTTGGDIVYPATGPSAPTTGGDIDYTATGPSASPDDRQFFSELFSFF